MQLTNTETRYGAVGQALHWLTAALVIVQLVFGKTADIDAAESSGMYFWHSSIGVTILLLVALRISWRLVTSPPRLPATMSRLARGMAHTLHSLFYVLLIAVPLSGWFLASSEGAAVTFFGTTLPGASPAPVSFGVVPESEDSARADDRESGEEFWEETHELLANVLLALAILHMLAALKHHFVDKDDTFRRMLPRRGTASSRMIDRDRAAAPDGRPPA